MCGIAGFWDPGNAVFGANGERLTADMLASIRHRGPDDSGHFTEPSSGMHLGHRRLSIVDLSPLGHQPMSSESGRYIIVYNGEVYNHRELRIDLEAAGASFRGHSDTEVMLAAFERWGIKASLSKFNGMFAAAVWDRKRRVITLIRDRLGIKPLYFGRVGRVFVFASEMKPFRTIPGFQNSICRGALGLYMRHNYVPSPYSIFEGIFKLRPGCLMEVDEVAVKRCSRLEDWSARQTVYWSAREAIEAGVESVQFASSSVGLDVDSLHDKLREAVRLRMIADVPLGAFLSGGVDSSTVVALMQELADGPVQTFSIGFHESGFDEAIYARQVAEHLGTRHTELYVSPVEAMDVIPKLPQLFDEPFSDSSQIPTYLVSALARSEVTVSLSGDGGDELFAGYARYIKGKRLWDRFSAYPTTTRRWASNVLNKAPDFWASMLKLSLLLMPKASAVKNPRHKVVRLAELIRHGSAQMLYQDLVSHWNDPSKIVRQGFDLPTAVSDLTNLPKVSNDIEMMMAIDLVSYLPDDILTKVDRASMAVSLEARVPLLDHNVVEHAWTMPFNMKLRDGEFKWSLKQILRRYLPESMIDRPKMGFGVPIGTWMRNELRDWADDLLDPSMLRRQGYIDPAPVARLWQQHRNDEADNQYLLWDVLMFQAWLDSGGATARESDRPNVLAERA